MAARSTRKRKTEDSDGLNDLPIQIAKKTPVFKAELQEQDLPEIYLPEIDLPLNSNIASERQKIDKTKN